MWSSSKALQDYWQSTRPILVAIAVTRDGVLEGSMPSFHHAICFMMVGWRSLAADAKHLALLGPIN